MRKPTVNELLEAVRAALPTPPSEEWMTRKEIITSLKVSQDRGMKAVDKLRRAGKLEQMRAPCRGGAPGHATYYRFKRNGK